MRYIEFAGAFPDQIKKVKEKHPIAYLPMGLLEWHGEHNIYGLDAVKAHYMAKYFAEEFGGLVMPPMYYAENRDDICENVFKPERVNGCERDDTAAICEKVGFSKSDIEENAKRALTDGWRLWKSVVVHTMFTVQSMGIKKLIAIPGHYPFVGHLESAIAEYRANGGTVDIIIIWDMMYDKDGVSGDHAARFETSVMMYFDEKSVDLSRLDNNLFKPCLGVLGDDPRVSASAELGRKIMDGLIEILRKKLHVATT